MGIKTTQSDKKALGGRLTETVDLALDREVRELLITARVGLLLKHSFFGKLATRLQMENADSWLTTAATDGRKFYYNTEFIKSLKPAHLEFLFAHEVLHVAYDHLGRAGDRDQRLFNCAADFCVNGDLVEHKIGERIVPCLYDTKYKGMSAEEVYEDLYNSAEKIDIEDLVSRLIDEHADGNDADGEQDGENKKSGSKLGKLSEEELKKLRDEVREAILQAAQTESNPGNIPAGIRRLIKDLTNPVINWKDLIQQQIQSTFKDDYSWTKINRKGWDLDAILPGTVPGDQIDVCVGIDTSGSIGEDDIKSFMSEIKGIMESYDQYTVQVWSFDTSVYNHKIFTSDNLEDITDYEPKGGGGTDFMANWEYMKEHGIEPRKFIMFTDGWPFGSWGDPDYCDTVFVIKGNENAEPPFGVWAIYEHEQSKVGA